MSIMNIYSVTVRSCEDFPRERFAIGHTLKLDWIFGARGGNLEIRLVRLPFGAKQESLLVTLPYVTDT